jgi:hypothetical protein
MMRRYGMVAFALTAHASVLPPPLRGRAGEGGGNGLMRKWRPPSLSLPHKGGGNERAEAQVRSSRHAH